MKNADIIITNRSRRKIVELYGETPASEIISRITNELDLIRKNEYGYNYGSLFLVASNLTNHVKQLGYPSGIKSSIGASFLAFLLGITSVNPLPPHYHCPKCTHTRFEVNVSSGFDLADIPCPECGSLMTGDGHNILPESFFGADGSALPLITLNLPAAIALKEINEIAETVLQNDSTSNCLEIISSPALDALHQLSLEMNTSLENIPLNNPGVIDKINHTDRETIVELFDGNLEYDLLQICNPRNFSDLVAVWCISQGENVWNDRIEQLVKSRTVALHELPASRGDVFNMLLSKGIDRKKAFRISEFIRKGNGWRVLEDGLLESYTLPDWYVESCKTIKYLCLKDAAVNYVADALKAAHILIT